MPARNRSRRSKRRASNSSFIGRVGRFFWTPFGKVLLATMLIAGIAGVVAFSHFYWEYAKLIDAKLSRGPFNRPSKILAAPQAIYVGEEISAEEILSLLRNAGYSDSRHNRIGHFLVKDNSLEIYPGGMSYFSREPAALYFDDKQVTRIVSLSDNNPQTVYELEPELITNLFDKERSKRRLLAYENIPDVLVNAVLAIEDHRFFNHVGFDPIRTAKAAYDGIVGGEKIRGTSTLTQQLSRGFFLSPERSYKRKIAELMIALQLEARLSKEKILEHYLNQIWLGWRGSFNVMGMGEAARAYFDKDIREVSLAEAALLAGLIQRPSYLNPFRHPERAKLRRDTVLRFMERYAFITRKELEDAVQAPIDLAVGKVESSTAPYFVDLVNNQLQKWFNSNELITESYWVYTTIDMDLQRAAVEAIRIGMAEVDERVARQRRFRGRKAPQAQAALVVLDPKTGEVKAIVGGRNYGLSQLNRVLARRQPGSAFKPFVYATAIETAIEDELGDEYLDDGYLDGEAVEPADAGDLTPVLHDGFAPKTLLTPITVIDDVPTTFWWDDKPYEPSNFANKIYGMVPLRQALYKSLNIATVKVADMAGYEKVADMGRRVGLGEAIQATPAIALGAYEVTPLDIAGAYTALANGGVKMNPYFIRNVRDSSGRHLVRQKPEGEQALDPRVAYVVTHMLEDVIRRGTAVRVRGMGFTEPAAGKTGTDDDGWFAGYTSNLLCVVWVGFDDNTDLKIEGSKSALPIWTEFMKRAHQMREYRNPDPFEPVDGIVTVAIDPDTQQLATYSCADRRTEVFIAGSEPSQYCRLHGVGGRQTLLATNVAGWDSGSPQRNQPGPEGSTTLRGRAAAPGLNRGVGDPGPRRSPPPPKGKKKKDLFGRLLDVFR